jgi:hypothetical protein
MRRRQHFRKLQASSRASVEDRWQKFDEMRASPAAMVDRPDFPHGLHELCSLAFASQKRDQRNFALSADAGSNNGEARR